MYVKRAILRSITLSRDMGASTRRNANGNHKQHEQSFQENLLSTEPSGSNGTFFGSWADLVKQPARDAHANQSLRITEEKLEQGRASSHSATPEPD